MAQPLVVALHIQIFDVIRSQGGLPPVETDADGATQAWRAALGSSIRWPHCVCRSHCVNAVSPTADQAGPTQGRDFGGKAKPHLR